MSNLMETNGDPSEGKDLGDPLSFEDIAQKLFALLDDCDTADDIAKSDDAVFRSLVRQAHRKRFLYATTDGYAVTFNTP